MPTTQCRDCQHEVSTQAIQCPHCGANYPYLNEWDGWGFEYKSRARLLGLPLVHVSFKYRPGPVPVIAKGWLAIGQFAAGVVNVSQFGFGPVCVSQMSIAGLAFSQLSLAVFGVCQVGVVFDGWGVVLIRLRDFL